MPDSPSPLQFEKHLKQLEEIVAKLENNELSLEDSLNQFEQGVQLIKACQQALNAAEQKVQILLKQQDDYALRPFTDEQA